jgi:transcriptional regulator with XRE-family HTH domain
MTGERFGRNLLRCRKRAGINQEELSWRASLHRTEISQLERGLRVPRIDTLVRLAGALEVGTEELLEGIVWAPGVVQRGRLVFSETESPAALQGAGGKDG